MELNTTDVDKAKAFYTKLFDRELKDAQCPTEPNTMIGVGKGGTGGGMLKASRSRRALLMTCVRAVDDIKEATEKSTSLGAMVKLEPTEIRGAGWMSIIQDPTGERKAVLKTFESGGCEPHAASFLYGVAAPWSIRGTTAGAEGAQ